MFGVYRTILSIFVIFLHFGPLYWGQFSVISFFTLSGFLMTLLVNETYKGNLCGFALNRFLKIYPSFWFISIITAVLLLSGVAPSLGNISLPTDVSALLGDIFFISYKSPSVLISPAWSITNELIYYILIGLGISGNLKRTVYWFTISVVIAFFIAVFSSATSYLRYFSPIIATLPFSFGALIYHLRDYLKPYLKMIMWGVVILTGFILFQLQILPYAHGQMISQRYPRYTYLFVSVISSGFMTLSLYYIGMLISKKWKYIDSLVGSLSYPIYLSHYTAAMIIQIYYPIGHNWFSAVFVLVVTLIISSITYILVDHPIQYIRNKIRREGLYKIFYLHRI